MLMCQKCQKAFRVPAELRRHMARKTPCDPILTPAAGADDVKHACEYCGRTFASKQSAYRHMRQTCKIANTDEGMEKLMDYTLQRQLVEMKAQIAKLTSLIENQPLI